MFFFFFQIILQVGTVYVDRFRYSTDPLTKRVWEERMKPVEHLFSTVKCQFLWQNCRKLISVFRASKKWARLFWPREGLWP